MAAYVWGIANTDIAALIGYATIDGSSNPTNTQVTAWVKEFAAEVNQAFLHATGVVASDSTVGTAVDDEFFQFITGKIRSRVAAEWFMSNQRDINEWNRLKVDEFNAMIEQVKDRGNFRAASQAPETLYSNTTHEPPTATTDTSFPSDAFK